MRKLAPQDIVNVQAVAALGEARGRAGRWPSGMYEHCPDWQDDGYYIDRVAAVAALDSAVLLALYRTAHARGLRARFSGAAPDTS